ncbi:MAG TPA: nucleotidyltransferase family protein [Blastocatellia bacterium]|jgi:molybdenum cofactor cytidylyltransferase|nr:nucleotidyltransferase family protein [Blastocatellia bacterium]
MISALLLAAGESRRMIDFKQLLTFRGKTFVECSVDNLLESRAGEVIVVTGYREADVRSALSGRPVRFAHNPDYRAGMSSSIKQGVRAISDGAHGMLVALVDQPQIGADIFNLVIDSYERSRPLVVVPSYGGKNGHPVVIDLSLKDEILEMDPSQGLREVVHAHADRLLKIEVASDTVLTDFDYPEDYRRIK